MSHFKNKVALITGASRGLGLGLAEYFLTQGVKVAACARTLPKLSGPSEATLVRTADVCDAEAIAALIGDVENTIGTIDLWINNAGVLGPIDMMRNLDGAEFAKHLSINVQGVFNGSQAYVNHLHRRQASGGVLLNISSGAARNAYQGWAAYCASKSAVDRFTEVVAAEEHDAIGLRAYSVAPGVIDTDMQETIRGMPESRFPSVGKFHDLKNEGTFSSCEFVAARFLELAFDPAHRPGKVCIALPMEHNN